jgi:single-strand DNA-binding protein
MFQATIIGRLTRDSELKTIGKGQVLNFSLATSRKQGGEETTTFIECALWGKLGETMAQYTAKGQQVAVAGEVYTRSYTSKAGAAGTKVCMDVKQINLLARPGGQERQDDKPARRPPPKQAPQYQPIDEDDGIPF